MDKKKDAGGRKKPSTSTNAGMEDLNTYDKARKREAGYPGNSENAAGVDNKEKGDFNKLGSPPVSDKSVDSGEKR